MGMVMAASLSLCLLSRVRQPPLGLRVTEFSVVRRIFLNNLYAVMQRV